MTEFRKASTEVNELQTIQKELQEKVYSTEDGEEIIKKYAWFKERIATIQPKIKKFRERINEKDPEKQIYGPSTISKIQILLEEFDTVEKGYKTLQSQFEGEWQQRREDSIAIQAQEQLAVEEAKLQAIKKGRQQTLEEGKERQQKWAHDQAEANEREQQKLRAIEKSKKEEEQRLLFAVEQFDAINYEGGGASYYEGLLRLSKLPHTVFINTLRNVLSLITLVYKDPSALPLRVIRLHNADFQNQIGGHSGALLLLRAVGFHILKAATITNLLKELGSPPCDDDEYYLLLEEPDVMKDYERWTNWLHRIEKVHTLLETHTRSLSRMSKNEEGIKEYIASLKQQLDADF